MKLCYVLVAFEDATKAREFWENTLPNDLKRDNAYAFYDNTSQLEGAPRRFIDNLVRPPFELCVDPDCTTMREHGTH
jgi:hypothetical protein